MRGLRRAGARDSEEMLADLAARHLHAGDLRSLIDERQFPSEVGAQPDRALFLDLGDPAGLPAGQLRLRAGGERLILAFQRLDIGRAERRDAVEAGAAGKRERCGGEQDHRRSTPFWQHLFHSPMSTAVSNEAANDSLQADRLTQLVFKASLPDEGPRNIFARGRGRLVFRNSA